MAARKWSLPWSRPTLPLRPEPPAWRAPPEPMAVEIPITPEEAAASIANGALAYWAGVQGTIGTMGTDIHSCVEVKTPKGWRVAPGCIVKKKVRHFGLLYGTSHVDVAESWRIGRDYAFFAVLCGVRGGYDGRENILRIAERSRGIPDDVSERARTFFDRRGDHSDSYVTLAELESYNWDFTWTWASDAIDAQPISVGSSCRDFLDNILPKMQKLVPCFVHPDCREAGPEMGLLCSKRTSQDVRLLFSFNG